MWREIRLTSLGVIESAELELDAGLTVITGETGAGKTMVVTALGLLRGGRSDPTLVRHGDGASRIEGVVDVSTLPDVARLVEESPGEIEDGHLLLARTVSQEGRSRAFAGGAAVPAGFLSRVSELLVAVHGQSDQHRLLHAAAQREALDRFAGDDLAAVMAEYTPAYARLSEVRDRIEELTTRRQERARELDLLQHGLAEIEAAAPEPQEDEALVAEESRLAHADALAQAATQAHAVLAGSDESGPESPDAGTLTGRAQSLLGDVRRHDTDLDTLASRVDEVGYLLADLATDLASYAQSVDADPARLEAVQARRAEISGLTRKYGSTVAEVLDWAADAQARITELSGDDEQLEDLSAEAARLTSTLLTLAARLSACRRTAAERLGDAVSHELDALAMPHARVQVTVDGPDEATAGDLGPEGVDSVGFTMAANAGAPARPLHKGASGGELSRVMLALEVVLAGRTAVPTFVFDEVDAGIGGKAAVEVGRRLSRLARHAQVLAVTHLPQVAAFADQHYRVVKSDDGTVTTSGVHPLDEPGRIGELSRMLAGLEGSATAEAHAQELLQVAAAERADVG